MYATDSSPPSLVDAFAVVRRRWLPITLVAIAFTALAVGFGTWNEHRAVPVFQARHVLTLNLDRGQGAAVLEQLAIVATDGAVGAQAREELGGFGAVRLQTTVDPDRLLLVISGKGPDPAEVGLVANTVANDLVDYLTARDLDAIQTQGEEIERRVDDAADQLHDLQDRVDEDPGDFELMAERDSALNEYRSALDAQRNLEASGVPEPLLSSVADAQAHRLPIGGFTGLPHYQQGILGIMVGLLLGLGLAYVLDALDRRLTTAGSASQAFDLPVLAEVPDGGRRFRQGDTMAPRGSGINEAYRRLRTVLLLEKQTAMEDQAMVVLVVSPGPGEGKTTTAAHLARALGEVGNRVLAVSADFRRPRLHQLFSVRVSKGLAGLAEGDETGDDEPLVRSTSVPNVKLITAGAGTSEPTELIRKARRVIQAARGHFDFIVVDTSPLLAANDTLDLLPVADRVVIVARFRQTHQVAAERVREMLVQTTAPTLGVVVTGVPEEAAYGYGYGYGPTRLTSST